MKRNLIVVVAAVVLALGAAAPLAQAATLTVYQSSGGPVAVTPSQTTYSPGSVVTLSDTANSGCTFVGWVATGSATLSNSAVVSATMTINGNCTLTALYSLLVPLQISGGFNMDCIIGPREGTQAFVANKGINAWQGYEAAGVMSNNQNNNLGSFFCDTSSNDVSVTPSQYTIYYQYTNSVTISFSGNQALPENGLLSSTVDSRTYCIASVSGNYLLSGDWTEVAAPASTASNSKPNAIAVGGGMMDSWLCVSRTTTVNPGYYADLNFVYSWLGYRHTQGVELWAVYANVVNGSNSVRLIAGTNFSGGPTGLFPNSTVLATYGAGMDYGTCERYFPASGWANPLYELAAPLTLDSTRMLTSLTMSLNTANWAGSMTEVELYAVTARGWIDGGAATLTTSVSPAGGGAVAYGPLLPTYTPSSVVTIQATASPSYAFINWSVTGGGVLSNSTAQTTSLTINASCSLTANFVPTYTGYPSYNSTYGNVTLSSTGPYLPGQVITATATPTNSNYVFAGWSVTGASSLWNSVVATTTLTVNGNFTLTANFNLAGAAPLALSGFNMDAWVSPSMDAFCYYTLSPTFGNVGCPKSWFGTETLGYAFSMMDTYGAYQPVVDGTYPSGGTLSGGQGFPADGRLADPTGRSYYIASLLGNPLYPGDQIEWDDVNVGVVCTVAGIPSVSLSLTPAGYYTNLNLVLAAGMGCGTTQGATFMQIWAVYSTGPSGLLFDFGQPKVLDSGGALVVGDSRTITGPFMCYADFISSGSAANTSPLFTTIYTASDIFDVTTNQSFGGTATASRSVACLYDFTTPLTLDSTRVLTAIVVLDNAMLSYTGSRNPKTSRELAIFGATALAAPPVGTVTLTTSVSPPGAGAVTVTTTGGLVSGKAVVPIMASPNGGYEFDHWTVSDPNAFVVVPGQASTTLTTSLNNLTLTACFRSSTGYTASETYTGGTVNLTPGGPYSYTQTVGLTATAGNGWVFASWSWDPTNLYVWNSTASSTSMTVYDTFNLTANFVLIPYTVTTRPTVHGEIGFAPAQNFNYYGNVLTIWTLPAPGYNLVSWAITGATYDPADLTVASTTIAVTNNVFLSASFTPATYTVTVNQPPSGGTITMNPSFGTCSYGKTTTVTATVTNSNYLFSNWIVTGGTISSVSSSVATLTVQGNVTLSANFDAAGTLSVSMPSGSYTVTPAGPYSAGQTVTVATSYVVPGKVLSYWQVTSGASTFLTSNSAVTTQLAINGNTTLTAVYTTGSYVNNLNPAASDTNNGSFTAPFKTIGGALAKTKSGHGTTIVVLQGVYREADQMAATGTPGNVMTLMGNPGDRVVVTGADPILSWSACTISTSLLYGNPNYAHLYYADIPGSWLPQSLTEDDNYLTVAQSPAGSWWAVDPSTQTNQTTSLNSTIIDTVHLTGPDNYWVGADIAYWYVPDSTEGFLMPIKAYSAATHTLTVSGVLTNAFATSPTDRYYLMNRTDMICGPGQWVVVSNGASNRVFVWPSAGGRPDGHLYEANRRAATIIYLCNTPSIGYWTIQGLELRDSLGWGNLGVYSCGGQNNTIQNCVIHHNGYAGISTRDSPNDLFQHNIIADNGAGCANYPNQNAYCGTGLFTGYDTATVSTWVYVKENEIYDNFDDAITPGSTSITILGNYIHDHWHWEHADSIQFTSAWGRDNNNQVYYALVQNNLIMKGGDFTQANSAIGVTLSNNTCLFSSGWSQQGEYINLADEHNTIYGANNVANTLYGSYSAHNNLFYLGLQGPCWSIPISIPLSNYYSDYNLFFELPGVTGSYVVAWHGFGSDTLNEYVARTALEGTPEDAHSLYADPQMATEPHIYLPLAKFQNNDIQGGRVYLLNANEQSFLTVGDYIEVGLDNVTRTITNIGTSQGSTYIDFSPSDAKFLYNFFDAAIDWKNSTMTSNSFDPTLLPTSPALGAASDGLNLGSNGINIAAYKAGLLNGATTRVLPNWPPIPANVLRWAVVATHSGGVGDLAVTTSEGQVEPRSKAVKFQIAFDSPIFAPTISLSGINALTITGTNGTNFSSYISSTSLDVTGQILNVTLSAPLPDQKWYTFALNPLLTAANGGPVLGVKSVKIGLLAGNVTGSGRVSTADVAAERSYIGLPVTPATARFDIDSNGVITAADQRLIQSLVGHSLP